MNKKQLLEFLEKQDASVLIELLELSYDVMKINQRQEVFGSLEVQSLPSEINQEELLKDIQIFVEKSLARYYYASFEINSKNFMYVPQETENWFEELGDFLKDTTQISKLGNHHLAVKCFQLLYQLIEQMESGEEIVFAEEIGSWMIPGDEKEFIRAYIYSSSLILTPKQFLKIVLPLIKRDSYQSLSNRVFDSAIQFATPQQKNLLTSEIRKNKIRIE